MRIFHFEGSVAEIGHAFGEATRAEIHELYRRRVANAIEQAARYGGQHVTEADMLAVAQASLPASRAYFPDAVTELEAIAHAADLPLVQLLAMNGLTDFRDALAWPGHPAAEAADRGGCTAIVAQGLRDATPTALSGQSWDLATDNLPFVIAVTRRPKNAPATRALTTVGCLSLIGMNSHQVAVGTTNLRTRDARPGVNYLLIIHKALAQVNHDDAIAAITSAPRAGAHFYHVTSPTRATFVECSAQSVVQREVHASAQAHANHALEPAISALEGAAPNASSLHRQARMTALGASLFTSPGALRPDAFAALRASFSDSDGGQNAICRDDFDGLNTNGAVAMDPARDHIEVVHGVPSRGTWVPLTLE